MIKDFLASWIKRLILAAVQGFIYLAEDVATFFEYVFFEDEKTKRKRKNDEVENWAIGDDGEIVTDEISDKPETSHGTAMK